MNRKNTLQLKQQLADSLGESGKEYWRLLGEFLSAKCSKQTLDAAALAVFTTPQQAKIHNKLILSILYNLSPNLPPPVGQDKEFVIKNPRKRMRYVNDPHTGKHIKKMYNTKTILSMTPEERTRLFSVSTKNPKAQASSDLVFPKGLDSVPRNCVDDGDIPTHESLRTRIKFISALQGLDQTFSDDAVNLLDLALENYMKNLMSNMLIKTRSLGDETRKELDLENLRFSIEMTPQKLDTNLLETILP